VTVTNRPTPIPHRSTRRSIAWVVLAALAIAFLALAAFDRSPDDSPGARALGISSRFACPVCNGQSIAESDATIARAIRKDINTRLEQGQTEQQISDYLIASYGDGIDLRPKATGVTGLVWILPVFALVCAVAGLVVAFRRWRSAPVSEATEGDRALVEQARRDRS
jgi:cytochrome c-type biogenesis protein CcmH